MKKILIVSMLLSATCSTRIAQAASSSALPPLVSPSPENGPGQKWMHLLLQADKANYSPDSIRAILSFADNELKNASQHDIEFILDDAISYAHGKGLPEKYQLLLIQKILNIIGPATGNILPFFVAYDGAVYNNLEHRKQGLRGDIDGYSSDVNERTLNIIRLLAPWGKMAPSTEEDEFKGKLPYTILKERLYSSGKPLTERAKEALRLLKP